MADPLLASTERPRAYEPILSAQLFGSMLSGQSYQNNAFRFDRIAALQQILSDCNTWTVSARNKKEYPVSSEA